MSKSYNFYCTICGDPFSAAKNHARCCSAECRTVLSRIMRYDLTDGNHVKEAIDKDQVASKYNDATGEKINPKALSKHPDKPKDKNGGLSIISKKATPPENKEADGSEEVKKADKGPAGPKTKKK